MNYNKELHISTAGSRKALHWPESVILWSEFAEKLKTPVRGTESYDQYLAMSKAQQAELKDVGGFVGGTFEGGRRKPDSAIGRDLLTLDLDNIPAGQTEDILHRVDGLGCAAAVYSTRKHAGYAPRLRIIVPLDRTALPDEYEPAARKLAALIGMEFCDPTTFEVNRLMYWPSCSNNAEYVYQFYDKPFASLDGILAMYGDWQDVTQWPQVPGNDALERRRLAKQEDPTTKRGVIGAFCRTYTITQAMDRFIPGIYEETATTGRYTYTGGTTQGGAIVYDGDLFLYSHHATDPCSGQLVNAFDLVRLHKFGEQDAEAKEGTPVSKLPSFLSMSRMALDDKPVSDLIAKERHEQAVAAFAASVMPASEENDMAWSSSLSVDGNGNYQKTVNNIILVLQNDPMLRGRVVTDEFSSRGIAIGPFPWDPESGKRQWTDNDDSGFFWYIESYYKMAQKDRLNMALSIVGEQNKVNVVRQYLQSLRWDGIKRVDTLLIQYLGAEDNEYTRAVIRKFLCAAVARAVEGGTKFDYMPILTGPQGIGKSTFLNILGKEWFSDSLTSFEGKEAAELIQGTWINEVGELTAMTRQETSAVKQFLSKREDIYRAAYGRRTDRYPRRCVFCGTSNDTEFLKDSTGNRRFWPVDVGVHTAEKSVWRELPEEADQIWAEAYLYWSLGEPLYLPKEIEALASDQQEAHMELSGKESVIVDFIERKIPSNWDQIELNQRRMYWNGNQKLPEGVDLVEREKVCALEIWCECFGANKKDMHRADTSEINGILARQKGWKRNKDKRRYGPHGAARGFERCTRGT
ncbi:MAG: virulence-associated E family protein [Lachnospiraceae bacterium]|nr:virulence-associated E family protein [Lachnospiraceae bacterium]